MSVELLSAHGLPDTAVLGDFLQRQRWFAGRGRALSGVGVHDVAVLHEGEPALLLVLLSAAYADGGPEERYQVPLAVRHAEAPADLGEKLLVQNEQDGGLVSVYDALAEPALAWWFWQAMAESRSLTTQNGATVVPAPAVTNGQQGTYVYVLNPDSTATARPIQVDRADDVLAVVASGLTPGETVITDGQFRLGPGARVVVRGARPAGAK